MDSDELYLERLEALYAKQLGDVRAFAAREGRPFDEVRTRLAEWHCKDLFAPPPPADDPSGAQRRSAKERGTSRASLPQPLLSHPLRPHHSPFISLPPRPTFYRTRTRPRPTDRAVTSTLRTLSHALSSLHAAAGLHALFLVVDPADAADGGFLGGTPLAREWWRGQRGGGAQGARALQAFCRRGEGGGVLEIAARAQAGSGGHAQVQAADAAPTPGPVQSVQSAEATTVRKGPAGTTKAEVYASIRNALRTASHMRTAEMKWTNHARLDQYGVRLVGWPAGVPAANPSTLSTAQNRALLDALGRGELRFVPLAEVGAGAGAGGGSRGEGEGGEGGEGGGGLNAGLVEMHAEGEGQGEGKGGDGDGDAEDVFAGAVDFSFAWDDYTTGNASTSTSTGAGDREGTGTGIPSSSSIMGTGMNTTTAPVNVGPNPNAHTNADTDADVNAAASLGRGSPMGTPWARTRDAAAVPATGFLTMVGLPGSPAHGHEGDGDGNGESEGESPRKRRRGAGE
ncbi:hypothetical protein EIP86_007787 [Pleurotus ostreatoroseus]|nr:hypothetical protein EIP86_007787 [Pleurotus ostreatoroseus]